MKWLFVPVFLILVSPAFAIANPASVYCAQHGGKLTIVNNKNGQVGICLFPDRSYCEEWSYMRGTCKPGQRFLTKKVPKYRY
ncbi:hemolysin [Candidatus Rickettsiella viridis]|uniref:Hemolysin n=1 Tax=Candidatus Rickettsiella viridis TaxID=676208 RepID=A0A2Z5UXJ6_9COXI|nr:DUF333 domain-containing protein [Candidatus Rickettsiella viridis]BBB15911.1 hemolysin [Candidatus Rickettsiella viridis]